MEMGKNKNKNKNKNSWMSEKCMELDSRFWLKIPESKHLELSMKYWLIKGLPSNKFGCEFHWYCPLAAQDLSAIFLLDEKDFYRSVANYFRYMWGTRGVKSVVFPSFLIFPWSGRLSKSQRSVGALCLTNHFWSCCRNETPLWTQSNKNNQEQDKWKQEQTSNDSDNRGCLKCPWFLDVIVCTWKSW